MRHERVVLAFLATFGPAPLLAEPPPADAKPLSEIINIIESQGYAPVTEVEFERGLWEIEAIRAGSRRELRVDPYDGKIVSDRPND